MRLWKRERCRTSKEDAECLEHIYMMGSRGNRDEEVVIEFVMRILGIYSTQPRVANGFTPTKHSMCDGITMNPAADMLVRAVAWKPVVYAI